MNSAGRRSMRHADETEHLVVALDHLLHDLAQTRRVVLLLGLRLERAALAGHEQPRVLAAVGNRYGPIEAQHARLVEGLAGRVVLLPVGIARLRVAGHDDAGLAALDARQPRVAGPDHLALGV